MKSKQVIIILIVVGFLVYGLSIKNGFVSDDEAQIVDNTSVHTLANWQSLLRGSTFYNGGQSILVGAYFRPVMTLSFTVLYTLFGPNAWGFHLFSLVLHLANVCLIYLFLKRYLRSNLAILLALVFLVHPINSAVVFYASSLNDSLFFFFGMLALLAPTLALSSLLLFLSLLSKETGVAFVLMLPFFKSRKAILASAAALGVYLLWRHGLSSATAFSPIASLNLGQRLLNWPVMIWFYLKTVFFPLQLASSYNWVVKVPNLTNFWLPGLLDIGALLGIVICGLRLKSNSYWLFSSWLIAGLGLHLQIIPLDVTVRENWFYFPLVGLLAMVGLIFQKNKYFQFVLVVVICLFSLRTFVRGFDWRDNLTLNSRDAQVSGSFDLENTWGHELIKLHDYSQAEVHIRKSVQAFPYMTNLNNLGLILLTKGDLIGAKQAYERAIAFGDYYLPYQNMAALYIVSQDYLGAVNFINQALVKFPNNAQLWLYLAVVQAKLNHLSEAKKAIERAYSLNQSSETKFVYDRLENNQPFNLQFNFN